MPTDRTPIFDQYKYRMFQKGAGQFLFFYGQTSNMNVIHIPLNYLLSPWLDWGDQLIAAS